LPEKFSLGRDRGRFFPTAAATSFDFFDPDLTENYKISLINPLYIGVYIRIFTTNGSGIRQQQPPGMTIPPPFLIFDPLPPVFRLYTLHKISPSNTVKLSFE